MSKKKLLTIKQTHVKADNRRSQLENIARSFRIELFQQITHYVSFHRAGLTLILHHD